MVCLAPRGRVLAPKKGSAEVALKMKSVSCEGISNLDCTLVLTDMAETAKDLERIQEQFENGSLKTPREAQERLSRRRQGLRRQSICLRNGERGLGRVSWLYFSKESGEPNGAFNGSMKLLSGPLEGSTLSQK